MDHAVMRFKLEQLLCRGVPRYVGADSQLSTRVSRSVSALRLVLTHYRTTASNNSALNRVSRVYEVAFWRHLA